MTTQQEINKFIYLPIYLSDYVSQSRKLTMLQRGAFIDLSVLYFQENLKLNYSKEQIYRMVFAFEKEEREAVDFILDNYFIKSENKPVGFSWVSNQLNDIGDKVLKKLNASRENGKKGGRGKKSENKPVGYNSLNPAETILNESKLNQIKLNENNNNLNNNNSDLKEIIKQDKIKTELDLFCEDSVTSLKQILVKKLNKAITTNNWSKEIKLIVNNDLKIRGEQQAKQDLTRCIKAIESNYGKDYFPIIQSAKSLREKFIKIEDYLARSNKKSNEPVNFIDEANNIAGMKVFLQMEVLSNKVEIVSNGKALDIPPEKRALIKAIFEGMFGKKEMVVR